MYSLQLARRRELESLERTRVTALETASLSLNCPSLSSLLRHSPQSFTSERVHASSRLLRVLDALPAAQCSQCTSVYLSHNLLQSLSGIEQFPACATLSLANNPLDSWAELRRLHALPRLAHLTLAATPLSTRPYYRARVLMALVDGGSLPLATLDGVPVGAAELAAARATLRAYDATLSGLLAAEWGIWGLAVLVKRLHVHTELMQVLWGARRVPGLAPRCAAAAALPPPPPTFPSIPFILRHWEAGFPRARVGLSLWRILGLEGTAAAKTAATAAAAAEAGEGSEEAHFSTSLLTLMLSEVELKAAAYVKPSSEGSSSTGGSSNDDQWRAAFSSLSGVQASVMAELQLLAASCSETFGSTLESLALKDRRGVLSREGEGVQQRESQRREEAARTSASLAGAVRQLKWQQVKSAAATAASSSGSGSGGGRRAPGTSPRAAGSASAHSARPPSRGGGAAAAAAAASPATMRFSPSASRGGSSVVSKALGASRTALLRTVDPFTAALFTVTRGRSALGHEEAASASALAASASASAVAAKAVPSASPAAAAAEEDSPPPTPEEAHLSTLARLIAVVTKGSKRAASRSSTHTPAAPTAQSAALHRSPSPSPPSARTVAAAAAAAVAATPVPAAAASPLPIPTLPPSSHATLASELESMDPPTLRSLVLALSAKLSEFAEANAHNASVAAQQIVALTARTEASERRAAEAEEGERVAREAGEAAGAVLFKEASRLKAELEVERGRRGGEGGAAGAGAQVGGGRDVELHTLLSGSGSGGGGDSSSSSSSSSGAQ